MHADDEILDVAIDIKLFAGTVRLVTGDTGMRLAALNEGLEPLVLPRTYRRDLTDDPTPPADTTGGAEHASLETLSPIAYELRHDTEASDHAS